jgi:hypothetical protein
VKTSAQRNDSRFRRTSDVAPPTTSELERALVGLGTGITKEDSIRERLRHQGIGQLFARRAAIQVGHVYQPAVKRVHNGRPDSLVVVAKRVNGNAANKVQVTTTLGVYQFHTLTAHKLSGRASVNG